MHALFRKILKYFKISVYIQFFKNWVLNDWYIQKNFIKYLSPQITLLKKLIYASEILKHILPMSLNVKNFYSTPSHIPNRSPPFILWLSFTRNSHKNILEPGQLNSYIFCHQTWLSHFLQFLDSFKNTFIRV